MAQCLAILARVGWTRFESRSAPAQVVCRDMAIEAIVEPFAGVDWRRLETTVYEGIRAGVDAFNSGEWSPDFSRMGPATSKTKSLFVPGARLVLLDTQARRQDASCEYDMTDIHCSRAAILMLSDLSGRLEKICNTRWLGWETGSGGTAFNRFYSDMSYAAIDEMRGIKTSVFPHDILPDLGRRMERIEIEDAASPAQTPSIALRI
jgi:hypothetical protein